MSVSRDPEILALRALVKVLFETIADSHENELLFHGETQRRAEQFIVNYTSGLPASSLRKRAIASVATILADPPVIRKQTTGGAKERGPSATRPKKNAGQRKSRRKAGLEFVRMTRRFQRGISGGSSAISRCYNR